MVEQFPENSLETYLLKAATEYITGKLQQTVMEVNTVSTLKMGAVMRISCDLDSVAQLANYIRETDDPFLKHYFWMPVEVIRYEDPGTS